MKTLGIGVDIVENLRFKKLLLNKKFLKKVFTKNEIIKSKKVRNKCSFFAKRFAAKEAFSKALGTGFRKNLNLKDISIKNNKLGKPEITINKKLNKILFKNFKSKKINTLLSLSDENNFSVAFVLIQKK